MLGKKPKEDPVLKAQQQRAIELEQDRQNDLTAQEAAQKRAIDSGRVGRSLLAYTPPAGAQGNLGG